MKGNTGRIVHIVVCSLLLLAAIVCLVLTCSLAVSFWENKAANGEATDFSTALGTGIGAAFAIVLMIIFTAATEVVGVASVIVSSFLCRVRSGIDKKPALCFIVSTLVVMIAAFAVTAVTIAINNGAA